MSFVETGSWERELRIEVLGPLTVGAGFQQAAPNAGKPRQILSLLLLNHSQVVPTSALMAEIWNGTPPKSAVNTVQTYIVRLRKMLARSLGVTTGEVAARVLQTRSCGYAFSIASDQLDLPEYRRLESAGLRAQQIGDDVGAVTLFDQALRLWRGPALMDVQHGPLLEVAVAGLEQSRLSVVERRFETKLRLGQHQDLLSDLASMVLEHPYNENLHAQFMLALHRSGQRIRALEVFRRLRSAMIEELGLEPSGDLQRLQQAILSSDPGLDHKAFHGDEPRLYPADDRVRNK